MAACPTTAFIHAVDGGTVAGCLKPDADKNKECLGYIDAASPPRWQCEDKCLASKTGYVCGKTDHL